LQRKGPAAFLRDRALRLGVPFIVLAGVIAPLAYVPSYLQTGVATPSLADFWRQLTGGGDWPSGPAWFLWMLLVFDALAAAVYALWPRPAPSAARRGALPFFALLVVASAAAYLPLAMTIGPFAWASIGPFVFQTSRALHYAVYFFAGVIAGAAGFGSRDALARRWPAWVVLAPLAFGAGLVAIERAMTTATFAWAIAANMGFVLSCAATSFALLSLFVRFVRRPSRLAPAAYGIYVVHYAIVSWLQLAFLGAPLPAAVKGLAVTAGALALSWATVTLLRRIPIVARVL
jgi:peptidoglycan/LPS O-acetylase OafA/YrhL